MSEGMILEMIGLVMESVEWIKGGREDEHIRFITDTGRIFLMKHDPQCCEYVFIEDIDAPLATLVGAPLLQAEESYKHTDVDEGEIRSRTWSFYKFATQRGHVTIRWCGSSNGCYSERAVISEIET